MSTITITATDLTGTETLGRHLGRVLGPGTVVALMGPLGAGKTQLTRAIAEGLGVDHPSQVNSPTFVLIQEYDGPVPLFHFDTYRLPGPREFAELGVEEYLAGSGVCVIEWADKVSEQLPADLLRVELMHLGPLSRRLTLTATGPRHHEVLDALSQSLADFDTGSGFDFRL